jgi:hypothetical protein
MAQFPENEHERALREEYRRMREDEVIDLVRETVVQLSKLADRLEEYTKERVVPGERPIEQQGNDC